MTRLVALGLAGASLIGCAFAGTEEEEDGVDAAPPPPMEADPPGCTPVGESCNGADDDCDELVDEDFPELGQPCDGADVDLCLEGVWVCGGGTGGVVCSDDSNDTAEICNGADDDCNGMVDDGLARTYELTTGPVSSSSLICCDAGDTLADIVDCGTGGNHDITTDGDCGIPYEGNGNNGDACATITCTGPCIPVL